MSIPKRNFIAIKGLLDQYNSDTMEVKTITKEELYRGIYELYKKEKRKSG